MAYSTQTATVQYEINEAASSACRDYQRIEQTLNWLAEHLEDQPPLAEIAARSGLSEYHFQRLFTRWVGLSPKKFLQYLTLERAKKSLEQTSSVLDAAFDSGLSGPGRLHDLFVKIEAMTPGEYKARGAGLSIRYGFHASPFGECLLMHTERGICGFAFVADSERANVLAELGKGWEQADFLEDEAATAPYIARLFGEAIRQQEPIKLFPRGTPFQIKVWEALLSIPPGALATYEDIARRVGNTRAVRAVGGANACNPVAYLIPCHRVIRKSGVLGGYRWGLGRKLALIGWEAAESNAA